MSKEKIFRNIKKQIKFFSKHIAKKNLKSKKNFEEDLEELLYDVQKSHIYEDDKIFVDLVPRYDIQKIKNEYFLTKDNTNFQLSDFISRHFTVFGPSKKTHCSNKKTKPREYIKQLWGELERSNNKNQGSLIALPNSYIVPGGRFNEQFYWDSYFIMLGLAADERWDLFENMI